LSANPRSIPSGGSSASARIVGRVLSGLAVVGVVALLLPGLSVLGARVAVDAAGLPVLGAEPTVAGPGGAVALLRGAGVFAVVRLSEGGTVGRGLLRRSGRRLRGSRFAVGRPAAGARRRTRRGAGLTVGGPPISGPGGGLAGGAGEAALIARIGLARHRGVRHGGLRGSGPGLGQDAAGLFGVRVLDHALWPQRDGRR